MSHVTDIILITTIEDGAKDVRAHPNAEKLSQYLEKNHGGGSLEKVDEFAGGRKAMQCDVFMSAINRLDIPEFVKWFKGIEWEMPESVQLLLKDEHDDSFTVHIPDEI